MRSRTDRSDDAPSDPDSKATVCRGINSGVLVGLALVAAAHMLDIDGGHTVINLGYAVAAGLAIGEVTIDRRVRSDCGSTTQPRSSRSLRAVGATVGVALTTFPFTLHPFVVSVDEAVVGSMAAGGATLFGVGWFLTKQLDGDDRQIVRTIGVGVLVVALAVLLSS